MLLYARQDQFEFEFPISFVPQQIKDKYEAYLNRIESPITDAREYLNHTLQVISLPGINYTPEVQNQLGTEVGFRSSTPYGNLFDKEFEITFLMTEGFINYFILFESFLYHYAFSNGEMFIDPFRMYFTDSDGIRISSIALSQILFTGMDRLENDITNNTQEGFQFTAKFKFNKIAFEIINQDVIETPDESTLQEMYDNVFDMEVTSGFEESDVTEETGYKTFTMSLANSVNCKGDAITDEKVSINFVRNEEVIFAIYGPADEEINQTDIDSAIPYEISFDENATYGELAGQYKDAFVMEVSLLDFCGVKREIINIDEEDEEQPNP